MSKDKYSMIKTAEFELRSFTQSLAKIAQDKKLAYDDNKLLDLLVDGTIKMSDWLKDHLIANICDVPMVIMTMDELEWMLKEFAFDNIPTMMKVAKEYGYCVINIKKANYRTLVSTLDVIVDPDKAMSQGTQRCCEIIEDCPDTMDYYYKMVPTLKGSALNNSALAHMKIFAMPTMFDACKALFSGRFKRTLKLQKWLLKNGFIEPKRK